MFELDIDIEVITDLDVDVECVFDLEFDSISNLELVEFTVELEEKRR